MTEFESTIKCEHSFPLGFQYYYTRDSIDFLIHRKLGITQSPLSLIRKSERMFVIFPTDFVTLQCNMTGRVESPTHPSQMIQVIQIQWVFPLNNVFIFDNVQVLVRFFRFCPFSKNKLGLYFSVMWKCLSR